MTLNIKNIPNDIRNNPEKLGAVLMADKCLTLSERVKELEEIIASSVLMPSELTAENGAKYIFLGEFKEQVSKDCFECHEGSSSDDCEVCNGTLVYSEDVPIGWDTIKNIYALAVEKLSIK